MQKIVLFVKIILFAMFFVACNASSSDNGNNNEYYWKLVYYKDYYFFAEGDSYRDGVWLNHALSDVLEFLPNNATGLSFSTIKATLPNGLLLKRICASSLGVFVKAAEEILVYEPTKDEWQYGYSEYSYCRRSSYKTITLWNQTKILNISEENNSKTEFDFDAGINDLVLDKNNNLWVINDNNVYFLNSSGKWESKNLMGGNKIFFTPSDDLWVLNSNGDLYLINTVDMSMKRVDEIDGSSLIGIWEMSADNVWIVTHDEVWQYNGSVLKQKAIPNNESHIYFASMDYTTHRIYLATDGGLYYFYKKD